MGGHMARNLINAGNEVKLFDLNQDIVRELSQAGGIGTDSIQEVSKGVDTVITMLPSSPHVKEVICGSNGVLGSATQLQLVIDASTIDPNVSKEVAMKVIEAGVQAVDAPVSGGVLGAEKGTLTFMVGGTEADFALAKPTLDHMGSNVVHCGAHGSGQAVKLCNNLVLAIEMIGVCEGMHLGKQFGVDPTLLASIFNSSTARSWSSDSYNPVPGVMEGVPSSNDYNGGFGVDLMLKDLGLATEAGKTVQATLPLGDRVRAFYQQLSDSGFGGKDFSVGFRFLDELNKH